jgi:amino-acid N-acetyltransferase
MNAAIRVADAADRDSVCDLLTSARLPLDGLSEHLAHFLVAEEDGRIVAAAGLEQYDDSVLLRSVVVEASHRGTGIGAMLSEATFVMAQELGARHAYLLTDTAEAFFRRRGFEVIDRKEVPPGIRNSVEFAVACPASAIVMRRAVAPGD